MSHGTHINEPYLPYANESGRTYECGMRHDMCRNKWCNTYESKGTYSGFQDDAHLENLRSVSFSLSPSLSLALALALSLSRARACSLSLSLSATHCSILQHTAIENQMRPNIFKALTSFSKLPYTTTLFKTLQQIVSHCITLHQRIN